MKAQVISLFIKGQRGEAFWPEDAEYFGAELDAMIGPIGGTTGEIFQATVCSPSWFAQNRLKTQRTHLTHENIEHPPQFGGHYLFANSFDEAAIRSAVETWVESHDADDWPTLAQRLSRNLAWEFEDYSPQP